MNVKVKEEFGNFKVNDVLEGVDYCAAKSLMRQGKVVEATLEEIALKHGKKKEPVADKPKAETVKKPKKTRAKKA